MIGENGRWREVSYALASFFYFILGVIWAGKV